MDDKLWDMSDEELEAAYKEAIAESESPDTDVEEKSATTEEEFEESEGSVEEEFEEVDEDGPDQTESEIEESDHDSSEDADTDEVEEDNTDKTEADSPDGDTEEDDAESSDEAEEDDAEPQPAQSYSFRANGKDYEFSSEELVQQFPKMFGKAMDYTKKMQTIKPWRKTIDAIEGAKLSHDDVSLMIDVLKGDKEAITEVLKRTGTDTLDLDTEADSNYITKDYGRDDGALEISDIVDEISKDAEYSTTHSILSKEWDEESWGTMAKNPDMIRLLHTDVKSGMYKTLQPIAEKLKVYDNNSKNDLDYYKLAAEQHFSKNAETKAYNARQEAKKQQQQADIMQDSEKNEARISQAKAESGKRVAAKKASAKRKAAAPTKSASANNNVTDYLDESDESFDDWYKALDN